MVDLFLWLGAAILTVRFFMGSKPNARNYVDCSCQTDPEKIGEELEGEPDISLENLEEEGVQTERKAMSPYVWEMAYWPSEGGI